MALLQVSALRPLGRLALWMGMLMITAVSVGYASEPASEDAAASPSCLLEPGDFLVIAGDSITEQLRYSVFMESYLLACHPELDLRVFELGWSGETTPMFLERMDNDLLQLKADCVTYLYGVNDASYTSYTQQIGDNYRNALTQIVSKTQDAGLKMVLGAPTAADTYFWNRPGWVSSEAYNASLARLTAMASEIAQAHQVRFNNVFGLLMDVMAQAKAAYGEKYPVTGSDGIHPFDNGQLVLAYSFLKALGLPGDLGQVVIDMQGEARAQGGHQITASSAGQASIESERYIFCFYGDGRSPDSTLGILPFIPFNEELNRFVLRVENLQAPQADVTWGEQTKRFSRAQLEEGINLAAQFTSNPFCGPLDKFMNLVREKQHQETLAIKQLITGFRLFHDGQTPQEQEAIALLRQSLMEKDQNRHERLRENLAPVQHHISVQPVED